MIMAMFRSITVMALTFQAATVVMSALADERPPNIIIIFADDLGYGDLSCYGHPTIHTPNLDRMVAEGMKWTSFYSAAAVCTPSRAALLTGRLPLRSGMAGETRGVIFPDHQGGIPHEELTMAEGLKSKGYATACIGKWHLGHPMEFRPLRHGFDYWFGPETSNDGSIRFELPLWRNDEIVEKHPFDQSTLTRRYTEESVAFIQRNKDRPFFLYLPHTFPHTPLHADERFRGRSQRGLYGDVVEELDWSVGQILDTLRDEGLAQNTLVVFTSDNGPWLIRKQDGGSAGLLRAGKGSSFEGGFRVPGIFWWPGRIKPGQTIAEMGCTMDLYTTSLLLAGVEVPTDRIVDGLDLRPVLFGTGPSPREEMFFYIRQDLYAVRSGPWKAHFITRTPYTKQEAVTHDPPMLFHLENDPSEKYDVAEANPQIIARLREIRARHQERMRPGIPQY